MGRPRIDDPKRPLTIYLRASTIARMERRPEFRRELAASIEAKYGSDPVVPRPQPVTPNPGKTEGVIPRFKK